MTNWYYEEDGEQQGPVDSKTLKRLAGEGRIRPSTLVWRDDTTKRVKASMVKGLFSGPHEPPPVPRDDQNSDSDSVPNTSGDKHSHETGDRVGPKGAQEDQPSHHTSIWARLGDMGRRAKQAGELGKLYARRTQIQQLELQPAFAALGAHIHQEKKFADSFPDELAKIDAAVSQQTQATTNSGDEPRNVTGKLKSAADGVVRRGKEATVAMKLASLHRTLGEAAYRALGTASGPQELVVPVEKAELEIKELQSKIDQLEATGTGRVLTPKRLLVGIGIIVLLVGFLVFSGPQSPTLTAHVQTNGIERMPIYVKNCNASVTSLTCSVSEDQLVIEFEVDASKWQPPVNRTFPLLVRLFDENGEYLSHFTTAEGFTVYSQIYDTNTRSYEGCMSAGAGESECNKFKCELLDSSNTLTYGVDDSALQQVRIVEVGFTVR